ncbi:uncharacterized protein GGS22DRAFT_163777 [Annulohypoxylon maeteangense]|uniref:uncharacterized protein n=1 Tax=Annulohypoxylon maeteangense TaxID=1927788 RepID=UPI0020081048|nr:uncharacterized protein GGS22DRAFT_163777 [Annulohypoxylon maeteangense]KAI0884544.1 hypothetical protein GGS22DRAFT_163777 [Annulohypoxylon maeteangense]
MTAIRYIISTYRNTCSGSVLFVIILSRPTQSDLVVCLPTQDPVLMSTMIPLFILSSYCRKKPVGFIRRFRSRFPDILQPPCPHIHTYIHIHAHTYIYNHPYTYTYTTLVLLLSFLS